MYGPIPLIDQQDSEVHDPGVFEVPCVEEPLGLGVLCCRTEPDSKGENVANRPLVRTVSVDDYDGIFVT